MPIPKAGMSSCHRPFFSFILLSRPPGPTVFWLASACLPPHPHFYLLPLSFKVLLANGCFWPNWDLPGFPPALSPALDKSRPCHAPSVCHLKPSPTSCQREPAPNPSSGTGVGGEHGGVCCPQLPLVPELGGGERFLEHSLLGNPSPTAAPLQRENLASVTFPDSSDRPQGDN